MASRSARTPQPLSRPTTVTRPLTWPHTNCWPHHRSFVRRRASNLAGAELGFSRAVKVDVRDQEAAVSTSEDARVADDIGSAMAELAANFAGHNELEAIMEAVSTQAVRLI